MASHRTQRLKIFGEAPEVQKLFGSRYRIVVRAEMSDKTEDWYYANKSRIFADFGSLYSAEMAIDGIEAHDGEAYPNARLVSHAAEYLPTGRYVVRFVYETLTDAFVQEAADKVDYELNGLRRVTRPVIAKDGTSYGKTVGTSSIIHTAHGYGSATLYLASAVEAQKPANEDGYVRIVETWLEPGELSRNTDNVGSQQAITITSWKEVPSTPSGYVLARTDIDNTQGFPTRQYTFLKSNVEISRSTDLVGSQQAIVIEQFDGTPDTPSGYVLARTDVSEVDGIPTNRYTFLKPSVLSQTTETRNQGALTITTIEAFNQTPSGDGVLISESVSNFEGIPTRRYVYAQGEGEISRRSSPGPVPGTTQVVVESIGTRIAGDGVEIAESQRSENGYVRYTVTSLSGEITGTKYSYTEPVTVPVPGTVTPVSQSVDTGTIALYEARPPTKKTVTATTTLQILDSSPDAFTPAFNMDNISCSVNVITTTSTAGLKFNQSSVRFQFFEGSYLTATSASGRQSPDLKLSVIDTQVIGSGSTDVEDYVEEGIIRRRIRPLITAIDGTIYFEVLTTTV